MNAESVSFFCVYEEENYVIKYFADSYFRDVYGMDMPEIKLPSLLGMLITGIVLGPYVLNLLDDSILGISAELRKIALIIILTRAGLGLDLSGLKKIGRPAVLMCFVPASFELIGMILLAPKLMGLTVLEAAIMGAVLAAVHRLLLYPEW